MPWMVAITAVPRTYPVTVSQAACPARSTRRDWRAGSEVVSHRIANIGHPDGREWRREDKESLLPVIDSGVELVVLEDPGDEDDPGRKVRATVREGTYKGRTYLIARRDLRPKR